MSSEEILAMLEGELSPVELANLGRAISHEFSKVDSSISDQERHGDYLSTRQVDIDWYENSIKNYNALLTLYRFLFPNGDAIYRGAHPRESLRKK